MLSELPVSYRPAAFMVRAVASSWEQGGAMALRRAVFCIEQGIFIEDDRDLLDDSASLLVALSVVAGDADEVVGTVRFHRGVQPATEASADAGVSKPKEVVFWGSRLAVHPGVRGAGRIGSALIRRAVSGAVTLGATRFFAHVQSQNVGMFEALHWRVVDDIVLHGRRHAVMEACLAHYPALVDANCTELIFAKSSA